ncbi:signal peptidase II [Reyranella sp.]|uniref:signal peptidase II n=1 Tax=Reyranella sp. TaxID=1929291 RepID=UPI001200414A|nr:signal peptidase II [Reyranella sp.]TAJ81807.1 MAG: signal peptidase II [Reyranella sp.]
MKWSAPGIGSECAIAAYIVDQVSKAAAIAFLSRPQESVEVLPIFDLVLARNRGVSFGLLTGLPWWALAALGLTAVTLLSIWLWRTRTKLSGAAVGLIIGGALGNIADRIRWGAVTDFLDFHVGQYHWPAFNFADVAIVSGVGLLFLQRSKPRAS